MSVPQISKSDWPLAAVFLLIVTGCAPDQVRMYEQRGEYHKAYELCREALAINPHDQAAAVGLRRNAPAAAIYWREQAVAAAMRRDWRRAALCHRQVLEIKPDEKGSIDALRQLAQQHPDEVALASSPLLSPPLATTGPAAGIAMGPTALSEPAASKGSGAPARAPGSAGASGSTGVVPARGAGTPRPHAEASAPPTARTGESAAEPPPRAPAGRRSDPYRQKPTVHRERGATQAEVAMIVYVSREDARYPKRALLTDGLSIKVKDTDPSPLDADMELYLSNKRIGKFEDLQPGSVLSALGRSGRAYELIVMLIEDNTETVKIGLRRGRGSEEH